MTLSIPTIHLNGTSREGLIDPIYVAREAISRAIDLMGAVCPNGRDYYPQGTDAIQEALRQHNNRIHHMQAVYDELGEIAAVIFFGLN